MTKSSDKSEKAGITAADFMAEARALTLEGMRKRAAGNRPSALDRLNELLGQKPATGKDEARQVTQPQPVTTVETISTQPVKPAPLSLDEAVAAATAESKAKKEWLAAEIEECKARDAKLSALSPDAANMARKLMGLPPRSNAPKPLTPVRGVSVPTPPRTPASAAPEPASTPIEEAAAPIPAPSASAPAVAPPEPVAAPADAVSVQSTGIVRHSVKNRRSPLAAVFARAKREATDSTCPHSVWASLVAMATGSAAPPELTDYREDKGIQATGARDGWLSKDAFLDRWRRGNV